MLWSPIQGSGYSYRTGFVVRAQLWWQGLGQGIVLCWSWGPLGPPGAPNSNPKLYPAPNPTTKTKPLPQTTSHYYTLIPRLGSISFRGQGIIFGKGLGLGYYFVSGYNFGLGHNFYEIVCFVSFTIKIVRFDMNRLIMIVCFLTIVWLNIVCFIWKFTNFGIVCFLIIVRFNIVCIRINVGEGSSELTDRLDFFQRSSVLRYTQIE